MAEMLGIMMTRYENVEHILGTVEAARAAGKQVMIFMTDEGVRFTRDARCTELIRKGSLDITACEHSCEQLGIHEKTEGITYGSQYNNAGMLHHSARILVF